MKKLNKILKNDFDFSYLLLIERFKLKRMVKCFSKFGDTVDCDKNIRDMSLCIRLITIALQEDSVYKKYLKACDTQINWHYINTKNYKRFWNWDTFNDIPCVRYELRTLKALYLYNKIRNRMFRWWF